jgi:hypothetical protein
MAAGRALGAVLEFLYTQPRLTADRLHRPLYELLAALDDLNSGRVAPMLTPVRFGNRPPRGSVESEKRGHTIATIEQLIERGDSVTQASREVANVWKKEARNKRDRSIRWSTIKSWYDRSPKLSEEHPERVVIATYRRAADRHPEIKILTKAQILANLSRTLNTIGTSGAVTE